MEEPKDAPVEERTLSPNEPAGSNVYPPEAPAQPTAPPVKGEGADPDELEAEIEDAEDDDDVKITHHRTTTTVSKKKR